MGACTSGSLAANRLLDANGFANGWEKRIESELQADANPPIKLTRAMRDTALQRPEHTRSLMTTHPTHTRL